MKENCQERNKTHTNTQHTMNEIKLNRVSEMDTEKNSVRITRAQINNTKGFKYDPKLHQYTLDGQQLVSGTELLSKYVKPFDSAMISEISANKYKREGKKMLGDARQVRRYWKLLGEHASSLGTAGHAFCVLYWLNRETKPVTELDHNAKKAMDAILHKYEIIEMEVPRGNKKYLIGYTMDLLMRDKVSGEIVLGDFKFSGKFTNEQYKALKGKNAGLMNEPFKEFRDIAHDKGSIQLEIYRRLLKEDTGIEVNLKLLIHIDGLGAEVFYGTKGYKVYIAKECSEQVESILKPLEVSNDITDLL